ncbi:Branched-chain-amino-acid aminotransferase [compost metagenome]
MAQQLAYFQGDFVPLEEANINILTHAFNYGTGCFEGIRAYWNAEKEELYVLHLEAHFRRLERSAKILHAKLPHSVEELCAITMELIRRCGYRQDIYLRPTLYKADHVMGVKLHNLTDELCIYVIPMGTYVDIDRPLKVGVSSWRRINDNQIPARAKIVGAYVNSAFAKTEANLNGFDEAIFLNEQGHVCEGSAENLFMVRAGALITPGENEDILEGITRASIIELAQKELGLETINRAIDRSELYVCDEIFLCGTGAQIAWVNEADHRPIGTGKMGPITAKLRELYFSAVRGDLPQYSHWLDAAYGTNGATMFGKEASLT